MPLTGDNDIITVNKIIITTTTLNTVPFEIPFIINPLRANNTVQQPAGGRRSFGLRKCDRPTAAAGNHVQEHQKMAVTVADTPGPVGARVVRVLPTGRAFRRKRIGPRPATGQ